MLDIQTLQQDEIGLAAAVIANAFHEDAMTVYLYPDEQERSRLAPLMFAALVRYDCLFGQVDVLPGFTGVATWLRPGATSETPEGLAAAGFDDLPAEIPLERLDAFFAEIVPAHERAAPDPHWYLRLLAVDPMQQGRGLGSTLLKHGLRRADASGQPCYLETFAGRNVPFYLRHGFGLVEDVVEPASGVRIWGFYRPARTPAALYNKTRLSALSEAFETAISLAQGESASGYRQQPDSADRDNWSHEDRAS